MRRQIDHHLARARAVGRRSSAHARALVWTSLEAVERAVARLYEKVTIDLAGDRRAMVRVERQDMDEMLGNLIENAAKYGGGRVFVTVLRTRECVEIEVEDDGPGIPPAELERVFEPFHRCEPSRSRETGGVGLGLPIARNIFRAHGGDVTLANRPRGGAKAMAAFPA